MKFIYKLSLLFLFASFSIVAQPKITIESIYSGAFRAKGMDDLQALKNTNQYTVLNFDRASRNFQIDLYDFATLKKVATLIDTKDHKSLEGIDSYTFSSDEKTILIANNSDQIFRHSFVAKYFLYEIDSKKLTPLFDFKIQEPTFSPDGTKIAFAKENNLYE
jgi:dipeptidyl-peptidase-4